MKAVNEISVKFFFVLHCTIAYLQYVTIRSSRSEVFCKKGVLENFAKFTGKHLCQSLFLIKRLRHEAWNFIKKETLAQVFTCEFSEISKNTFFYRTPPVAASVSYIQYGTCCMVSFLLETFTCVINFSLKEKCLNRFILPKVFYCVICCCKTGNVEFL